jgi:hypothetical protein
MKFFVTSICALLALSSAAIAQNISAEDFDLACAVTAGATRDKAAQWFRFSILETAKNAAMLPTRC